MRKKKKVGLPIRTLIALLSVALLLGGAIGGTLAWLTDKSEAITNTFTDSNIGITLVESDSGNDTDNDENTNSYKMIPGKDIEKDPKVTVLENSEPCWLFVKVTKENSFDDFMKYEIAEGWTKLNASNGVYVYYREITADSPSTVITEDKSFGILAGNKVTVLDTVTKEDMKDLAAEPKLTFQAYAIQRVKFDTAAEAWEELNK